MPKVIILGAKGRFGRAATQVFKTAGWEVATFARGRDFNPGEGVSHIVGDVKDTPTLSAACAGCDVIVNSINPPYEDWSKELPVITKSVIAAAKASGATVLIPGNLYNFGAEAPAQLTEVTPWQPTTRKGRLRVEMEEAFRASGVRTIVLRAGDYIEREKSGNWFDMQIAAKAYEGRTVYPGPVDQVHAWAYLPDVARAAVMLADKRADFASFEEFGFTGYTLTGAELADAIGKAVGRKQKVSGLPWMVVRMMGIFQATLREVYEMRYLWRVPHWVDGQKLKRTLPDFNPTPVDVALKTVLAP